MADHLGSNKGIVQFMFNSKLILFFSVFCVFYLFCLPVLYFSTAVCLQFFGNLNDQGFSAQYNPIKISPFMYDTYVLAYTVS